MSFLDDSKFESLDWMSQITETIDADISHILAQLPDEFNIDYATLREISSESGWYTIERRDVIKHLCKLKQINYKSLSYSKFALLVGCFKFQEAPDIALDDESQTLSDTIKLVKTTFAFEDSLLQNHLGDEGLSSLSVINRHKINVKHLNNILDLLGQCEDALRSSSVKKKFRALLRRVRDIFHTNEWRIRNDALANQMCAWISGYVVSGNLADYANFCKLKVMTHQNMPIYSIKEIT